MRNNPAGIGDLQQLDWTEFPALLQVLKAKGYTLVGPTVRDGAIRLQRLEGAEDLPAGWKDEQAPRIHLERYGDSLEGQRPVVDDPPMARLHSGGGLPGFRWVST